MSEIAVFLQVPVSHETLAFLRAHLTSTPQRFIAELLESELASRRMRNIATDATAAATKDDLERMRCRGRTGRKKKLTPEQMQIVLHLRSQQVTVRTLAQRMGVGEANIRRVLADFDSRPHGDFADGSHRKATERAKAGIHKFFVD